VTYLIVGLDRKTHVRWHENVSAEDIGTAKRIAEARAAAQGLDLVVAAVIGPNSAVLSDPQASELSWPQVARLADSRRRPQATIAATGAFNES
jgi:hypothetical protein